MDLYELIQKRIEGSIAAVTSLRAHIRRIGEIGEIIVERLNAGGTLFTCGNGGSAAQAMHLAEELVGRYRSDRPPVSAVCLNADPTALTCIANDFGFDQVFARQCQALVGSQDVLVVFSTSGNSPNVQNALRAAKARGCLTVGFLGRDGGECGRICDHPVIVDAPGGDSAHIQESHQVLLHLLCEVVECRFGSGFGA